MTNSISILQRTAPEDGKLGLIKELRDDVEFVAGIRRGLEARRKGDRIHWNVVKAELGIE